MRMNKETKKKVINQINIYRSVLILAVILRFCIYLIRQLFECGEPV